MKLALDTYAHLDSPIHRWEQSSKIVALVALIFAFAFIEQPILLPSAIAVTAIFYRLSRLPLSFLLQRLRYPGMFISAVILFLPFTVGETVILDLGIVSLKQEGCLAVLPIVTRFGCILTISLILFGTAPFISSIRAMRRLGIPGAIVDMTLLSYRYLDSFSDTLTTMQRAMRLRGFRGDRFSKRNLSLLASLTGSLLIRSYDQSQRVYQAMILRGYRYQTRVSRPRRESRSNLSRWAFGLTMAIAAGFIIAEIFLQARI